MFKQAKFQTRLHIEDDFMISFFGDIIPMQTNAHVRNIRQQRNVINVALLFDSPVLYESIPKRVIFKVIRVGRTVPMEVYSKHEN